MNAGNLPRAMLTDAVAATSEADRPVARAFFNAGWHEARAGAMRELLAEFPENPTLCDRISDVLISLTPPRLP